MKTETTVAPVANDTTQQGDKMNTETTVAPVVIAVIKELTIKQEVTAITLSNNKNDNAKNTFFNQTLKRIRVGANEQARNSIVTSITTEIKATKATNAIQGVAIKILNTAINYVNSNVLTKFDLLEYNNIEHIVTLITKIKKHKGLTIGYQLNKDSFIVQVPVGEAVTNITDLVANVFSADDIKALTGEDKRLAYNDAMNALLTILKGQYGKKEVDAEEEDSPIEAYNKALEGFLLDATTLDIQNQINKLMSALRKREVPAQDVA